VTKTFNSRGLFYQPPTLLYTTHTPPNPKHAALYVLINACTHVHICTCKCTRTCMHRARAQEWEADDQRHNRWRSGGRHQRSRLGRQKKREKTWQNSDPHEVGSGDLAERGPQNICLLNECVYRYLRQPRQQRFWCLWCVNSARQWCSAQDISPSYC